MNDFILNILGIVEKAEHNDNPVKEYMSRAVLNCHFIAV
ncbi:hypothetical protein LWHH1689_1117 [Limosilactobacillus reuteri]|uniref:Uncharacterized protein n=1 Tax=Limosilactobacillus reuteri TaxID=1598 RepID=A0A2S1ER20_LIMRT|nr:hypothetical protein LWHH1689_1117 [Limosilactobacillus reuteri]